MASICREMVVAAPAEAVWDAVRDVGALHTRLVPGFVTDTVLEPGARIVTFANGLVARELIVDLDDEARRIVWSARSERLLHHNASLQVFAEGEGTRIVWTADLLPEAMRPAIDGMVAQGMAAMKTALERQAQAG